IWLGSPGAARFPPVIGATIVAQENELLQQLIPSLLTVAPRVMLGANGTVWADSRGMNAESLAKDLLDVFHEKGVEKVRAAISLVPMCAEVAASLRKGKNKEAVTPIAPGSQRA